MRYRDHRGAYEDSMKTTIEINSIRELLDHLNKQSDTPVTGIRFEYVGYDERNGWYTYYVLQRHKDTDWFVAGMSDDRLV